MLIIRSNRVTHVPAISLVMTSVLTVAFVHRVLVVGDAVVRLLPGFVLPALGFFAYAVFSVCRIERSGEQIHWKRLWRYGSDQASHCAIHAHASANRNGGVLEINLIARGNPVLLVSVSRNEPKAQARAQRVAEALGLPLEREPDLTTPASAGATKPSRGRRRGRNRQKR
jgi:hypothetical protein